MIGFKNNNGENCKRKKLKTYKNFEIVILTIIIE